MSAAECSFAIEQAVEQCSESTQQVRVPCCCTVAKAARNGHCEEMKQLIYAGTCNLLQIISSLILLHTFFVAMNELLCAEVMYC